MADALNLNRMRVPDEDELPSMGDQPSGNADVAPPDTLMDQAHAATRAQAEPSAPMSTMMSPSTAPSSAPDNLIPTHTATPTLMGGKERFHDTMRSFDSMTSSNRGQMLALDPKDPDYLQKLAGYQTKEGLIKTERANYEHMHPMGAEESAHPGMGGKILHVLGQIGNVAGDAFVPNLMSSIPGSQASLGAERRSGMAEIDDASKMNLQSAQADSARSKDATGKEEKYVDVLGPDGKPMAHNGQAIVRGEKTNKMFVLTDQGPVEIGSAQGKAGQSFFDKPALDENKQPIGQPGVDRHNSALNLMTKVMPPEHGKDFLAAYSVGPNDTLAVQTKRLEDAKQTASMEGAEQDRKLQRDIANRNHQDQQENIQEQRRIAGQAQMLKTGINPTNGEKLSIDNAPDEMLVNSATGKPIPHDMVSTLKPTTQEINRADFAKSALHALDLIDKLKAGDEGHVIPHGPISGWTEKKLKSAGLSGTEAAEVVGLITLARSAATGAHVGGRFNVEIMKKMDSLLSLNADDHQFAGEESALRDVMEPYAQQGGRETVGQYRQNKSQKQKQDGANTFDPKSDFKPIKIK